MWRSLPTKQRLTKGQMKRSPPSSQAARDLQIWRLVQVRFYGRSSPTVDDPGGHRPPGGRRQRTDTDHAASVAALAMSYPWPSGNSLRREEQLRTNEKSLMREKASAMAAGSGPSRPTCSSGCRGGAGSDSFFSLITPPPRSLSLRLTSPCPPNPTTPSPKRSWPSRTAAFAWITHHRSRPCTAGNPRYMAGAEGCQRKGALGVVNHDRKRQREMFENGSSSVV
jgi:hypothetical protein